MELDVSGMKLIVSGEGKQQFVEELKKLISIKKVWNALL